MRLFLLLLLDVLISISESHLLFIYLIYCCGCVTALWADVCVLVAARNFNGHRYYISYLLLVRAKAIGKKFRFPLVLAS